MAIQTKLNSLAATCRRVDCESSGLSQTHPGLGIRRITLDETRQKFEHGLYYVQHRSPGLDQLFMSETIETTVPRRSAL
jgi:hypothetical protein